MLKTPSSPKSSAQFNLRRQPKNMTRLEIQDCCRLTIDAVDLQSLRPFLFLFALLLFMTSSAMPTVNAITRSRQVLDTGWKFREAGKSEWHNATVPGCVHTDLLQNKLIEDPFYRDNEPKLQWIGKVDWEYESVFRSNRKRSKHNMSNWYLPVWILMRKFS